MTEKEVKKEIYNQIKALIDRTSMTALYLAIGLLVAIVAVGLLVYFFKREKFDMFKKYAAGVVVGFAVALTVVFAFLTAEKNSANPSVDQDMYAVLFYPILATVLAIVVGGIGMLIAAIFSKKASKIVGYCTLALSAGGFVAIMVEMAEYYKGVKDWYPDTNLTGLIISAVVFMVLIAVIYLIGDKRKFNDTKSLVYGAVAIALAYALSYVKFFRMPQGGSVTFASMLPLLIYSCMFGTRRGTIVALIYGTLQAMQDPWIIHPMQFMLDYTLAYGVLGVSGLLMEKGVFKNKKIFAFLTGGIIAVVLRYVCHVCSGVFAFADLTEQGSYTGALVYSLTYNSTVLVDMVIALAAGSVLFLSKSFTAQMQRSMDDVSEEKKVADSGFNQDHGDDEDFETLIVPIEQSKTSEEENKNVVKEQKAQD